jgi:sulfhydrogenase subunit alpha
LRKPMTLVEGEGSIIILENNGLVDRVLYEITEAPRFFEYILRGRDPWMTVDLISRVCGFCGVSYSYMAAKAFERCLGVEVDEYIERLREAIHLAERVKSHALHVFFMNLPELTNMRSTIELASRNPDLFRKAVDLVNHSRRIMSILGGRFHNVVNVKIGGVYRVPSREEVEKAKIEVSGALKTALDLADLVLSLKPIVALPSDGSGVCIYSSQRYPHHGDKLLLGGKVYGLGEFYGGVSILHRVEHSNATHYRLRGGESYYVGPVARFNKYYSMLRDEARELLKSHGWSPPLKVVEAYVARLAEMVNALLEIRDILESHREVQIPSSIKQVNTRGGSICEYAVEAPRGVLYVRFKLGDDGRIQECTLITPTAQNLASMEDTATRALRNKRIDEGAVDVAKSIAVAYDPCISCSVHALRVKFLRINP